MCICICICICICTCICICICMCACVRVYFSLNFIVMYFWYVIICMCFLYLCTVNWNDVDPKYRECKDIWSQLHVVGLQLQKYAGSGRLSAIDHHIMANRLTLGTSQTVRHFLAENSPIYPAISGTCVQRSTLEAIFTSQGYCVQKPSLQNTPRNRNRLYKYIYIYIYILYIYCIYIVYILYIL